MKSISDDENVKSSCERYNFSRFDVKIKILIISIEHFSDIGEIYTRLFDNRSFLSGEIVYFVKEFEVTNLENVTASNLKFLNIVSC